MNPEYKKALEEAPVMDTVYIPGLPADPIDLRAHMMWIEHNTAGKGNGPRFLAEAREAYGTWDD